MKQSYALVQLFRLAIVLLIGVSFTACEGPMGPVGPQGEKGEQGEKGDRGKEAKGDFGAKKASKAKREIGGKEGL